MILTRLYSCDWIVCSCYIHECGWDIDVVLLVEKSSSLDFVYELMWLFINVDVIIAFECHFDIDDMDWGEISFVLWMHDWLAMLCDCIRNYVLVHLCDH